MYLDFRSDNTGPISEIMLKALIDANVSFSSPYGKDDWTQNLTKLLTQMTSREIRTLSCATGSACNMLGLALLTPKYASVACHKDAHIARNESSGPEYAIGGKLVILIQGSKVSVSELEKAVANCLEHAPHCAPIKTLCITQANEWGLVYTLEELREIGSYCAKNEIKIHIDGARLHNALAYLKITLKDIIDACNPSTIALGPTKNGGLSGDILIILEDDYFESATYLHKKFGQLFSKSRFLSAMLLKYFEDDYWLKSAAEANIQGQKLAQVFKKFSFLSITLPVETNSIFITMTKEVADYLAQNKVLFYSWNAEHNCYRFVTTGLTTSDQLSLLEKILNQYK